jgi:hypothetical protein
MSYGGSSSFKGDKTNNVFAFFLQLKTVAQVGQFSFADSQ